MVLERIYLADAKALLSVRSNDSVVKWCNDNDVTVFSDRNRRFMSRIEFLTALERPFIQSLKMKYGVEWKEAYQAMETNDPAEVYEFHDHKRERKTAPLYLLKRYKPVSDFAKSFIRNIIQDE